MRILVIGSSGYVGRHLTPALLEQGHLVTATSRRLSSLEKEPWSDHPNIQLKTLDLSKPETLASAFTDIDIVFYLVHGMMQGRDLYQYEIDLAHALVKELDTSNVSRVIYLGALQPEETDSEHLKSRKISGEILRQAKTQVIELRSGVIVGPGSAAFEVMRDMVYHLPVMTTPKWVRSLSSPVSLPDLLYFLTQMAELKVEGNPILDIGGPEAISYEDQIRRFAKIIGKKRIIIKIPYLSPALSAQWIHFITSVPAPIAKALVKGLSHDLLPSPSQDISRYLQVHLQTFEEAVEEALSREQALLDDDIWQYDPDAVSRWQPGYAFYPKQAGYTLKTKASAEKLFNTICRIGGDEGYFYADWLWKIRAWMDHLIGGDALRKRRPSTDGLSSGDRIDSWKVLKVEKDQHLSLLFGMKAPGLGRLEFTITEKGDWRELDIRLGGTRPAFGGWVTGLPCSRRICLSFAVWHWK